MELKKQFLDYLRQVYGADSMVTSQSLPPLEVGPNYPAFQTGNLQGGLDVFARMNQVESRMGLTGAQGSPMRPQIGGPRPGPQGEMQVAQSVLLGG